MAGLQMIAVLKVLALVALVAGGWAIVATLFAPPLTSGWREGTEAVMRRAVVRQWILAAIALGIGAAGLMGAWVLVAQFLHG